VERISKLSVKKVVKNNTQTIKVECSIDTEYHNQHAISVQGRFRIKLDDGKLLDFYIFIVDNAYRNCYPPNFLMDNGQHFEENTLIHFANLQDDGESPFLNSFQEVLSGLAPELSSQGEGKVNDSWTLFLFFQIRDLTIGFGKEIRVPIYKNPNSTLTQRKGVGKSGGLEWNIHIKAYRRFIT
jgi:hypothetical protein